MPKRIVIFSEGSPPCSGGIAQWALGMAASLDRQGHSVVLFSRFRFDYHVDESVYLLEIHPIHGERWRQLRTWYFHRSFRDYLKNNSVDLIIATTWNVARGVSKIAEKSDIPLATVIHGLEVTRRQSALKGPWLRQALRSGKMVSGVSLLPGGRPCAIVFRRTRRSAFFTIRMDAERHSQNKSEEVMPHKTWSDHSGDDSNCLIRI